MTVFVEIKYLFFLLSILTFNFLNKGFAFRGRCSLAWLSLPTGCHQFGQRCWRKIGIESPAAPGGLGLIASFTYSSKKVAQAQTLIAQFGEDSLTKPHLPHYETKAVHVGLRAVGFSFVYLRCHVQYCSTYGSRDSVFQFGQAQVCHFDVVAS